MGRLPVALLVGAGASCLFGQEAAAANVTFSGVVLNTCVLTLSTGGALASSADGTQLSSEGGGIPALLAVISTGATPTLNFTAPTMTGPAGWSGSPVVAMKASGLGVNQDYTSSAFGVQTTQLLGTLTVNARATSPTGFTNGSYTIASTVTCQQ